jgi:hypothetical protein
LKNRKFYSSPRESSTWCWAQKLKINKLTTKSLSYKKLTFISTSSLSNILIWKIRFYKKFKRAFGHAKISPRLLNRRREKEKACKMLATLPAFKWKLQIQKKFQSPFPLSIPSKTQIMMKTMSTHLPKRTLELRQKRQK